MDLINLIPTPFTCYLSTIPDPPHPPWPCTLHRLDEDGRRYRIRVAYVLAGLDLELLYQNR